MFQVVKAEDAKEWVYRMFGRFGKLKESLLTQLQSLRKSEALSFPAGTDDEREIKRMQVTISGSLSHKAPEWRISYSKAKKVFVVIHRSHFNTNGKGE